MLDYVRPPLRFPKFLRTRRARVKNNVRLVDLRVTPKRVRFFAGFLRQFQTQRVRHIANTERSNQSEIIIYRVHGQLANLYKVAINAGPPFLESVAPAIDDPFPGPG
jgi:hypothetical protein